MGVEDHAEELLHLLYGVGETNVESINSGTAVTISNPNPDGGFSTTVLTLNGAAPVITMPTPNAVGQRKRLYLVQDATGSRVASWAGATVNWLAGVAPTLQTGATDVDFVDFESTDGTTWRGDAWQVQSTSGGSFTTLHVTGNSQLDGNLDVTGTSALDDVVTTLSDVNVGANLDVSGTSALDGAVTTLDAVNVGTNLDVSGTSTLDGDVTVGAGATAVTITAVSGNVDIGGTLGVDGAVTLDAATTVLGNFTVGAGATAVVITEASGNVDIGGTLGVDGTSTLDGDVTIVGKLGFNGKTAVGLATTYTQTYNTAARVIPAATAGAVATTGSTLTTPYGYAGAAQADAIPVAINALEADVLALKKLIVALVQDITAIGIAT